MISRDARHLQFLTDPDHLFVCTWLLLSQEKYNLSFLPFSHEMDMVTVLSMQYLSLAVYYELMVYSGNEVNYL